MIAESTNSGIASTLYACRIVATQASAIRDSPRKSPKTDRETWTIYSANGILVAEPELHWANRTIYNG